MPANVMLVPRTPLDPETVGVACGGKYLMYVGTHVMVRVVTLTFKLQYSYPNINMKVNCKQKEVKLTASKIGTHVMVSIVTKYGK